VMYEASPEAINTIADAATLLTVYCDEI